MVLFYQYSWLILLAPLFSFAVIIFGTRVWDMLSRPGRDKSSPYGQGDALVPLEEHGAGAHGDIAEEHSAEGHGDIPVVEFHDDIGLGETHPEADSDHQFLKVRGPHGEEEILEDEENPTVPELTI